MKAGLRQSPYNTATVYNVPLRNKGDETLAFQSQSHPPERLAKTQRLPLFDVIFFTSEMS